jgi:CRP-like cAMP-binding protein
MNKIAAVSKVEEHPKDTVLFNKDDEAKSLFILKEGTVNLVIHNGGMLSTSLTESGEVFGWFVHGRRWSLHGFRDLCNRFQNCENR